MINVANIEEQLATIKMLLLQMSSQDEILTVEETAKYLKISKASIYRLCSQGAINGHKIGGKANGALRFKKSELLTKQRKSLISIL